MRITARRRVGEVYRFVSAVLRGLPHFRGRIRLTMEVLPVAEI
ncbi:hypothetical protein [Salinibacterium sp.]|nr:hypothetical protein [Salinibacterium sp.]